MGSNIRYQNILLTHNGSDIAEDFLRFNRVALLLPTILTKFQTDYPDINIQVIEDNSIELQNMLVKGDIDLMLEQLPFATHEAQMHFALEKCKDGYKIQ